MTNKTKLFKAIMEGKVKEYSQESFCKASWVVYILSGIGLVVATLLGAMSIIPSTTYALTSIGLIGLLLSSSIILDRIG